MELREFITKSLLDVVGGVQDAQAKTQAGIIVPPVSQDLRLVEIGGSELQILEFEVVVRADEKSGREAGLSVVSAVFGAGIKGVTDKSGGHSAVLKFRVPVRLPASKK